MRKKYLCILICLFANALAFASAANRTITGVVISGEYRSEGAYLAP